MSSESPALAPIVSIFAIAQVLVILIPMGLVLFGIDIGNSTTNLVGSFAAATVAAYGFVKTYGRAPTPEERRRLAWLSLATAWAISLGLVALIVRFLEPALADLLRELFQNLSAVMLAIIVIAISALYLVVYRTAYGPMARKFEEKLAIKRSQAD